ncbi:peptide-methionine (S)-S-oxide reductase MsrA [Streptomyces poonensis]|uniref:Peptide methionine sulfoxide reductase MsrA n=1 Tax=Streptomyces poonensis TaxID=68255 RepID=A0A918P8X4_9ACTN|nr:peptide-methionine (S)-S-oxide reductase MsrA [Streptomyces poonensis]GGY91327.1 peptide methionine sulfoxide reductase MsrA [Streptomyces poonensis]GLJ87846.1 peptide methionine sulfoxide reductase MsrA [Streptomyces poonensis]
MVFGWGGELRMPTADEAPKGRDALAYEVPERHAALGNPLLGPYPETYEVAEFALGCFWGAERRFWQTVGVWTTVTGFQGGFTPYPVDDEVRTGLTGHAETVRVVFDPAVVPYERLLRVFWEGHDPTQGFRQGNDVGTHVRSLLFTRSPAQRDAAERTRERYQEALSDAGYGKITTEVLDAGRHPFYPARDRHQQYLHRYPAGYCGLGGTGVTLP